MSNNLNAIPRRLNDLNEAIQYLDQYYIRANSDTKKAWSFLSKKEEDFINEQLTRCIKDPCYYLENYHVIQPIQGTVQAMMLLDSQQMIYDKVLSIQRQKRPVKITTLKARQVGSSTLAEGLIFHKTIFTRGCKSLIVAQDPPTAASLFDMSRLAYERLPWWMRPEARYEAKGKYLMFDKKDDIERQVRPGMRSAIIVEAANKLTDAGRGQTFAGVHMSELSLWPHGGVLSRSLFPTMHADDELAFMESTARGRTGFWHEWWTRVENGDVPDWEPVFIPYYTIKKYSRAIPKGVTFKLTAEEQGVRERIQEKENFTISDETLNWVRAKKQEFIAVDGDEFGFYQEFPATPHESFQATGLCAFPKRLLQKVLETTCRKPVWFGEIYYKPREVRSVVTLYDPISQQTGHLHRVEKGERIPPPKTEGERFWVWEEPIQGAEYYIAVDVAMGEEGGDFSCVEVLRIGVGQDPDWQVAEWRGWINPTDLALVAAAIGTWYNRAEIAVECNAEGAVTNNHLFRVLEYDPLYRWKYIDKVANFITNYFGWFTNVKTRPLIIVKGREALMEKTVILRSEELVDEMMAFTREDDETKFMGRDTNDDRCMAFLIARYCAHEMDYGGDNNSKAGKASVVVNQTIYIFDDQNRLRFTCQDRDTAEVHIRQHIGWSMRTEPQKITKANTDWSPIHDDNNSIQSRLYEMGVPVEKIPPEVSADWAVHGNMGLKPEQEDDWRSY